jgi:hypothetical protein
MNTLTNKQEKDKLEQETRPGDKQNNKRQTTRQDNTQEQEINKTNRPTDKKEHEKEPQRHRLSDNQISWRHQQPNMTIRDKQTNTQQQEQEATRKQQQQQPYRSTANRDKDADKLSDTEEIIEFDEIATRKAAEAKQPTVKQLYAWGDDDDDTPEEEETMADRIRIAWLKRQQRDSSDTSDEVSDNMNSSNPSEETDDGKIPAVPRKEQDKQTTMRKRHVIKITNNRTRPKQQDERHTRKDLLEEKGETGQRLTKLKKNQLLTRVLSTNTRRSQS